MVPVFVYFALSFLVIAPLCIAALHIQDYRQNKRYELIKRRLSE